MKPVLVVTDSLTPDPMRLQPCKVPILHISPALMTPEQYRVAPLLILNDHSYQEFTRLHLPLRPGLLLALTGPDDGTAQTRATALRAERVVRASQNTSWLHLRMHAATACRYADWNSLLRRGPDDPPQPIR
ncbi:hypothetical protein [Streptomyces sp. NPDC004528]|uniref:hypothetical protein n=1 Tax=Streptomyces sp. NPDC004528 TaxID=3154550 RepID=UPI0033B6DC6A